MKKCLSIAVAWLLLMAVLLTGCHTDGPSVDSSMTDEPISTTTSAEDASSDVTTQSDSSVSDMTTTVASAVGTNTTVKPTATTTSKTKAPTTTTTSTTKPTPQNTYGVKHVIKTYMSDTNMRVRNLITSVGYQVNGAFQDFMFDSFIFLPSPAFLYDWDYSDDDGGMKRLKKVDWQSWIDREFKDGYNIDALDDSTAQVKTALGKSNYKSKVFVSLFYPVKSVTDFGEVNGKKLDFSVEADRLAAIKWMVDESLRQFKEKNYQNVELAGFYWFPESIDVPEDESMIRAVTDYVRSLGYITIWSPYYKAGGYDKWEGCKFDLVSMQANYFPGQDGPNGGGIDRLTTTAAITNGRGMGFELELHGEVSNDAALTGFKQYMKSGVEKGFMTRNHCLYYLNYGPRNVAEMESARDAYTRSAYDELYKFIKGTLKVSDITIQ